MASEMLNFVLKNVFHLDFLGQHGDTIREKRGNI